MKRPVQKFTLSLEVQLAKNGERSAKVHAQGDVSAWFADAARLRLRQLAAREALQLYEADAGMITHTELRRVRRLWPRI